MVKINKKFAFTIAEALISMLILSIFIGVSMKVFTKKHTRPVYNATHGYYMCYRAIDGRVYKKIGSAPAEVQASGKCDFQPVKTATYYVIYAVGGGGGGNGTVGGAPAEFQTIFVTNIADSLVITPGTGGAYNTTGGNTRIENNDPVVADREILTVSGGLKGGETKIKQGYVRSCKTVPLAKLIKTSEGKKYLDNNHDDKASCVVTNKYFEARLCPHSHNDIRQEDFVKDFYNSYAQTAYTATSSWTDKSYDHLYTVNGDCLILNSASASSITPIKKYCIDNTNGDKLYNYSTSRGNWYLAGLAEDGSATCLVERKYYDDIVINADTDSYTVIRTGGKSTTGTNTEYFKYIIDLHYDLTQRNVTPYYKESGFGEYIESSSLRDATTAVLYNPGLRAQTPPTGRFDPSAGDGGCQNCAGIGGAVFIAW